MGKRLDPEECKTWVEQEMGMQVLEAFPGPGVPWRMIHLDCSNQISPRFADLRKALKTNRTGCRHCKRRLDSEECKKFVEEKMNMKILEPYPGSDKPWRMTHLECGEEIKTLWPNLQSAYKNKTKCCKRCNKLSPEECAAWIHEEMV